MRWHGMSMFAAAGIMLLGIMTAPAAAIAQGDTVLKAGRCTKASSRFGVVQRAVRPGAKA